jgi:hypothetical protein
MGVNSTRCDGQMLDPSFSAVAAKTAGAVADVASLVGLHLRAARPN